MLEIRLARSSEAKLINDFYNHEKGVHRSLAHFQWQFREGPHGEGFHVLAFLEGELVGIQGLMPIFFQANEKNQLTGKSEDTLLAARARGTGAFQKMYALLIEECKKRGIVSIWGFTSAIKPFKKVGFEVPFSHEQVLAVFNVIGAYKYLVSLNENNSFKDKFQIFGLSCFAYLRWKLGFVLVNSIGQQKMSSIPSIRLDSEYMDWRLNPQHYNSELYFCSSSLIFELNKNKFGFIHHRPQHPISKKELRNAIGNQSNKIPILRDWVFSNNLENVAWKKRYKSIGFTALNRGIALVFLPLSKEAIHPNYWFINRLFTE